MPLSWRGGLGEPAVGFVLKDAPLAIGPSQLDRAIRRFPELAALDGTEEPHPGALPQRRLASVTGVTENYATILAIAALVPRSLPLHGISVQFHAPEFADGFEGALHGVRPGVLVQDNWWVSGRQRALSMLRVVAAEATAKKLRPLPASVQAVLAALGKPRKAQMVPFNDIMPLRAEAHPRSPCRPRYRPRRLCRRSCAACRSGWRPFCRAMSCRMICRRHGRH